MRVSAFRGLEGWVQQAVRAENRLNLDASRFILLRARVRFPIHGCRTLNSAKGGSGMEETSKNFTRRNFIKGVIAAGAAVSSASYLFRTNAFGQAQAPSAPGSVERLVTLPVHGQERRVDA